MEAGFHLYGFMFSVNEAVYLFQRLRKQIYRHHSAYKSWLPKKLSFVSNFVQERKIEMQFCFLTPSLHTYEHNLYQNTLCIFIPFNILRCLSHIFPVP
ncbi:hypothetical protein MCW_00173 [Cardidatus Bartonella washoeensis 085-0475]|uniref:Uncharacterized protein n=1 Tax=Cardidatus Bartonella washoeensis 085-0475 TaxID=1094564 RepID=J1JNE6_9HYPH|nr:hypothetical protein MCW_00173 [Bartonella washoeensis 085-0475]